MMRLFLPDSFSLSQTPVKLCFAASFSFVSSILFCANVYADQAIIVGGGSSIASSQAQIEANVKWAQGILAKSGIDITTFYTDGDNENNDVRFHVEDVIEENPLLPIASVFSHSITELSRYRNHSVPGVVESTSIDKMKPILDVLLGNENIQNTLFLFNGHGSPAGNEPANVQMNLWNNTTFSAADLHETIAGNQASFRFIFTQCYSGGFHRLAYKDSSEGLELADTERCGFTSESAYQTAEGCSASVNSESYQDYSTYFFAALSGYERDGEILNKDPDLNSDASVSLREAHLYTLEESFNTDLARSTSEDYLTSWEPWFLKWLPGGSYLPNNEYAKLFRDVATKYDIPLEKGVSKHIKTKQESFQSNFNELSAKQSNQIGEIQKNRQSLQSKAMDRWPSLGGPYTSAYAELAKSDQLLAVSVWLANQPEYQTIVALEKQIEETDGQILDTERSITQMYKLMRLRRLANLKQWLYDYGSPTEIADYKKLVSCEDQPLNR